MADRGRGGYRRPSRPAAVSPPQSGLRTDGGPGDKQPIRTPTGGKFGQAGALNEQQAAAPMVSGAPPQGGGAATAPPVAGGVPGMPDGGAFGPTMRPNESPMAGAGMPQSPYPDADAILMAIYERYPSPWIESLIG